MKHGPDNQAICRACLFWLPCLFLLKLPFACTPTACYTQTKHKKMSLFHPHIFTSHEFIHRPKSELPLHSSSRHSRCVNPNPYPSGDLGEVMYRRNRLPFRLQKARLCRAFIDCGAMKIPWTPPAQMLLGLCFNCHFYSEAGSFPLVHCAVQCSLLYLQTSCSLSNCERTMILPIVQQDFQMVHLFVFMEPKASW